LFCSIVKLSGIQLLFCLLRAGGEIVKLSARNQLTGKVVAVEKGVITAKVTVEVMVPATVTAVITKDSVEELDIKVGDEVAAIVKSTEIMIAK
jgi:molybdopterin-binding protein